jgi:hypothetical protein
MRLQYYILLCLVFSALVCAKYEEEEEEAAPVFISK